MNAQLRDNMLLTAPSLVTTDGDIVVATAANTLKRLAAFSGDVLLHELGGWEVDISALTTNDTVGGASAGVAEIKTPVTQAEAEAGTNTRFSLWSSLRVAQAIAALAVSTEATQSDMEDEGTTNANRYVSPEVLAFGPPSAKGWVVADGVGFPLDVSYNVSSLADNGTGDRTINWDTDFSTAKYVVVALGNSTTVLEVAISNTYAVGSCKVQMVNDADTLVNEGWSAVAFGDQ